MPQASIFFHFNLIKNYPIKKARNEILRFSLYVQIRCWQRAIFPGGGPPSIVASVSLYDRVRDDSAEEKVTKCHVF